MEDRYQMVFKITFNWNLTERVVCSWNHCYWYPKDGRYKSYQNFNMFMCEKFTWYQEHGKCSNVMFLF